MTLQAVGRRDEVDEIVALLGRAQEGRGGQIVELTGEAGIGKSTVVGTIVAAARTAGWQVWSATPTAAESDFPWTGLAQLLDGVDRRYLDALTRERARQLRFATSALRGESIAPEVVAFGLAALLDTAADGRSKPLLIAIDDVQWIDTQTAGALAYALRGTPARHSMALLAQRTGEQSPIEATRLVDPDSHAHIHLGGLSLAGLREVLVTAGLGALGRAELARIHQRTGGNPMYAVELVRSASPGASFDDASLPVSLRDTVGAWVRALPHGTRQVLGAAALTAKPSLDVLAMALPELDVLEALAPAEASGVIALVRASPFGGSPLAQFSHPLLATAAIDALTSAEGRRLHGALAATVDDTIERATHLIASGPTRDEATAAELERATHDALRGGALDTAVTLARAGHEATPANSPLLTRFERCHTWAEHALDAGRLNDARIALIALDKLFKEATGEPTVAADLHGLRERCAVIQARGVAKTMGFAAARDAIESALEDVVDAERRLTLHLWLVRVMMHLDARQGIEIAERVLGPGPENSGNTIRGALLLAVARAFVGDPFDADAALALVEADVESDESGGIASMLVEPLVWTDHPRTEEIADRAITHGMAIGRRAFFLDDLYHLTEHLFARGRWERVEDNMRLLGEYSEEFPDRHYANSTHAVVLAARGDVDAARSKIERANEDLSADQTATPLNWMWAAKEAAIVAHTLGDVDAADQLLAAERRYAVLGIRSVRLSRFRRDLVEALVAAGRVDEASEAVDRLTVDAMHNAVPTATADADAAAAVVAAARGEHDDARRCFEAAIAVQRTYGLDYELARTLLAAGAAARRAGQRRDSREFLGEARVLFEGMGAKTWIRRCDHEIERLGGRQTDVSGGLTATERKIADLVASGMSNVEVANTLFVSVRTVESNLTKIYRKLGIRSRAGLARTLAVRPA